MLSQELSDLMCWLEMMLGLDHLADIVPGMD